MGAFSDIRTISDRIGHSEKWSRRCKKEVISFCAEEDPETPILLEKIFVEGNLMNQRIILWSYAGFLRVSELLNLKLCDVNIVDTHMSYFIEKSKTDIYRDGYWLVISRTCTKLYPVLNLERYIKYSNFDDHYNYLFRNITKFSWLLSFEMWQLAHVLH